MHQYKIKMMTDNRYIIIVTYLRFNLDLDYLYQDTKHNKSVKKTLSGDI